MDYISRNNFLPLYSMNDFERNICMNFKNNQINIDEKIKNDGNFLFLFFLYNLNLNLI